MFDLLYMGSENLKIPIVGPKIKVVGSIWCDLLKLVREGQKYNEKRGYIFVFQKTGIITKPKQTECNVNSYNKDIVSFCKCECPDLIKQLILQG